MVDKKMFDLEGKTAIVSGASGGLGEAMAKALSGQGANIAIFDIQDASKVADQMDTKAEYYEVDVTDEKAIKKAIKKVKEEFGSIDILINNAGIYKPTPITDTDEKDFQRIIDINLKGYFLMAKNTVPEMGEGGRIINVASVAGHHAFAGSAAYNCSKGAVIQLTRTMAQEFAPDINTNAICPGVIKTRMTEDLLKTKEMKETMKNQVPKGRPGNPEELGGLAVYLASDESSYMNGSIITIDGGWTCHL